MKWAKFSEKFVLAVLYALKLIFALSDTLYLFPFLFFFFKERSKNIISVLDSIEASFFQSCNVKAVSCQFLPNMENK